MKADFFKTIKFKLAVVFAVILFVFTGTVIILFNVAIDNYLSTKSPGQNPPIAGQLQLSPPVEESEQQRQARAVYSNNLEMIQKTSIIGLFPLTLVCFVVGYWLAGFFLKPLEKLNRQIDKLKSDNLGTKIDNVPENELGKTMNSFNEMSRRLRTAFDQQARFVEDASHEIRTPLTIVKTNLETGIDDENGSSQELRDCIKEALVGIDAITELANDLLVLSQPQSQKRNIEDIVSIVNECAASMNDLACQKGVILEIVPSEKRIEALVNRWEFARATSNIIDNAIKYSENVKSAKVVIKVFADADSAIVEVYDNGIGIPASEVDKIFDRFYRIDKSRDRETGGFGLGLAITKKIIIEHGGSIAAQSYPNSTIFTIKIPLARDAG